MKTLNRRTVLATAALLAGSRSVPASAQRPVIYRNAGCGCCHAWSEVMADAGLPVDMRDTGDLDELQQAMGVPADLRGCHAGRIGRYVISGHVPPADISRLLSQQRSGLGLAVPGMPIGSPGMETGGAADPYDVILFRADGSREVFASYA